MHERSLVKSLLDLVKDEADAHHLARIHEVHVEIGEFSGVEPQLVITAFDEMVVDYWPNEVNLLVRVAQLCALCQRCAQEFHVEQFQFVCPNCGSCDVEVTSGEEIRITNIVAERKPMCGELTP